TFVGICSGWLGAFSLPVVGGFAALDDAPLEAEAAPPDWVGVLFGSSAVWVCCSVVGAGAALPSFALSVVAGWFGGGVISAICGALPAEGACSTTAPPLPE